MCAKQGVGTQLKQGHILKVIEEHSEEEHSEDWASPVLVEIRHCTRERAFSTSEFGFLWASG